MEPFESLKRKSEHRDNDGDRKRVLRTSNHSQYPHSLKAVRGRAIVVGTCDSGKEKQATKELLTLLEESVSRLNIIVQPEECRSGKISSIEAIIQHEADELRKGSDERFSSINSEMRGVVTVCVLDPKFDIVQIVSDIFENIRTTKNNCSRFLVRVVPLTMTCYGDIESLLEMALPMIESRLPSSNTDTIHWAINLKRRNTGLSRLDVIESFGRLVAPIHKVNIDCPAVIVNVEALMSIVGVSIVDSSMYNACEKFNLRRLQEIIKAV